MNCTTDLLFYTFQTKSTINPLRLVGNRPSELLFGKKEHQLQLFSGKHGPKVVSTFLGARLEIMPADFRSKIRAELGYTSVGFGPT